jgi:hypothetical protein
MNAHEAETELRTMEASSPPLRASPSPDSSGLCTVAASRILLQCKYYKASLISGMTFGS